MKSKTVFMCSNCGNETPKWQGRCPACGMWNTLEEYTPPAAAAPKTAARASVLAPKAKRLDDIRSSDELRFLTGLGELDRVLGGGAVRGSLVLVSGAPGIGKSTLLLQICFFLPHNLQELLQTEGPYRRIEDLRYYSKLLWKMPVLLYLPVFFFFFLSMSHLPHN